MGKIHDKSQLKDRFKKGHTGKALERGWYGFGLAKSNPKDPQEFANSSQLRKMKHKKK